MNVHGVPLPQAQQKRSEPHSIAHGFLDVGGEKLRIARTEPPGAEGLPLLIFNGIGASAEILEPLMRRLTRTRTITFDLPGIGASAPSPWIRRLSGFAAIACTQWESRGAAGSRSSSRANIRNASIGSCSPRRRPDT
jgi:pimeloyl-ACP methyl ester carboxylesterase